MPRRTSPLNEGHWIGKIRQREVYSIPQTQHRCYSQSKWRFDGRNKWQRDNVVTNEVQYGVLSILQLINLCGL